MTLAALCLVWLLQTPVSPPQSASSACMAAGDEFAMALCTADELLRRAEAEAKDSPARTTAWRGAAGAYRHAANVARDPVMKRKALEQLALVYDADHLARPGDAEPVVRELLAASPNELASLFRLAKLQESQELIDAAESTLIPARQQHPDQVEPYRELAEFYTRRLAVIERGAAVDKERGGHDQPAASTQPEPGTPDENGIYSIGGAVSLPEMVSTVAAEAPANAKAAGVSGDLVCEIVVDESGRVRDVKILRSIPMLDDAAIAAVRQWRYAPTIVDGRAVPVRLTVTVPFIR
jgi:TonB family protein